MVAIRQQSSPVKCAAFFSGCWFLLQWSMTTNPFARKDPELKAAVEMLATGQVSAALNALKKQDRIREIPDTEERIRAIARSYIESPERTLIVSPDNASRRELNDAVRQELT
jgi:hypothetical protein